MLKDEKIIEVKTCKHCNSSFEITDKDLEFYEKVSPIFQDRKYSIPIPQLCPDCRQQRRLSFRNERKLYKRKCDATGKDIISIYSPDKSFKVYHQEYWWSDKWDPMDYGRDFDFSRSFFEQFEELMKIIPYPNLITDNNINENSEYVNFSGASKNCYLVFENGDCEDDYYCYHIYSSKDCMDCLGIFGSNNCYECIDITNCSNLYYSINVSNCNDSYFLFDCTNMKNTYGCFNLRNKQYCIFNKQYSKEEYFQKLDVLLKNNFKKSFYKFLSNKSNYIHLGSILNGSENSSGDFLFNSKNVKNGYYSRNMQDSAFIDFFQGSSNIYDCYSWGYDVGYGGANRCYESISTGNGVDMILFSYLCWENSNNIYYSYLCRWSSNLFGCIGLHNKSYCILNKQYTKEQYETLVPKIIEHMQKTLEWGEFFPSSISPFGYNETVAMEYFPISHSIKPSSPTLLSKVEGGLEIPLPLGEVRGGQGIFNRSTYEPPFPKVDKIIKASMLPEDISQIPDDILNRAIECEITKKPFRIIKQELEFYRKHNLPIPKRHPDQRHLDRMSLRNPRKLFDRKCDKCGKDIKTTYSPDRKEIVYCEECYDREVY
ncbi:MAG: hypothetical protein PHI37_04000 [Candidatus Gracilibacteria bacterium]|nr:hypothetical protein [Candidatus Gracilibacteria bacterium]